MRTFKAALFDLDGTLIDTEGQYSNVWGEIGRKYHPEIDRFEYVIKGTTLKNILSKYFPDEEVRKEVVAKLYDFEAKMDYSFYPGVKEFIQNLKANGVKCCIVTSSDKSKMEHAVRGNSDIGTLFDRILTAEDFAASKPDPDCFLRAAKAMGCELDECIVFEDAPNGLKAGMSSGIFTVGVATGLTMEQITPLCHHAITSFESESYETMVRLG